MEPIDVLKAYVQTYPAPWNIGLWTVPRDEAVSPGEYTAGYFGLRAEKVDFLEGMVHLAAANDLAGLSLVEKAIGSVEEVEKGVIKFEYINFLAAPDDFSKPMVVVIQKATA